MAGLFSIFVVILYLPEAFAQVWLEVSLKSRIVRFVVNTAARLYFILVPIVSIIQ